MKHSGIQVASQHIMERETKQDRDLQPVLPNFLAASPSRGGSLWWVEPSLLLFPHEKKKKLLFSLDYTNGLEQFQRGHECPGAFPSYITLRDLVTAALNDHSQNTLFRAPTSGSTEVRPRLCPSDGLGTLGGTSRRCLHHVPGRCQLHWAAHHGWGAAASTSNSDSEERLIPTAMVQWDKARYASPGASLELLPLLLSPGTCSCHGQAGGKSWRFLGMQLLWLDNCITCPNTDYLLLRQKLLNTTCENPHIYGFPPQ